MLFAALLSSYVVRRGTGEDWIPLSIPTLLYLSVVPALAVSLMVRIAGRRLRLAAAAMATVFIATHVLAWRELPPFGVAGHDFLLIISAILVAYAACGVAALLARGIPTVYWHYLTVVSAILLAVLHTLR
jgi:hypothetical protein